MTDDLPAFGGTDGGRGGAIDAARDDTDRSAADRAAGVGDAGRGTAIMVASPLSAGASPAAAGAAAAARIAAMNSAAEANRSSGRFAIALRTTASKPRGAVTEICDGAGASVFSALCMIADMLPSNGRSPVSS